MTVSRRDALKTLGAAGAGTLLGTTIVRGGADLRVAGQAVEIVIAPVTARMARITVRAVGAKDGPVAADASTVERAWPPPAGRVTDASSQPRVRAGELDLVLSNDPLAVRVAAGGRLVQELRFDSASGAMTFRLGDAPVLGFGQGGAQFDRRGAADRMRSGQGGYKLATHGGRLPIPWLIGTSGWAMFVHAPFGTFDLTGSEGRFAPANPASALPLDVFIVAERDPARVMAEWAQLTGYPEMPPLWSFGYLQSHRTVNNRDELMAVARTFREKKLPCDGLIYLGTGFCPSGWNAENGSFTFNRAVFPDPKAVIDDLHALNFRVILHAVILARDLRGAVSDGCDLARYDEEEVGCYWNVHRRIEALGVDGWWPDEGDPLNAASRLTRNRMYWEGPQLDRPDVRPFALHRNGYAGMQRYASFLWSGDVDSTWETLKTHVPVAINTGLSGIPYWGTDTGGFVPTKEFTGELYARWFQFSAFCPLFRSHGRTWRLRLPWGWNTGEYGQSEISGYGNGANPDPAELHNAEVEPICRKYLELRYRLLPYTYTVAHEGQKTGLPIMRALWLHYPDDPVAVARGDEYLWGRDVLVAPVTEKGAVSRRLYLPAGDWFDFWTEEKTRGGREVTRQVDLATMPLYVRAGTILPLGPARQYTGEQVDGPLTVQIYPGIDGAFTLYEDDGVSFEYKRGAWTGIETKWDDRRRRLSLGLAPGSRLLPPARRGLVVRLAGTKTIKEAVFDGARLVVDF